MYISISAAALLTVVLVITVIFKFRSSKEGPVELKRVKSLGEMYFAGIMGRTSNKAELAENGIIGNYWKKFFDEKISKKIKNRISMTVYGIFTDYETDHNGSYSFMIAHKVKNLENIPEGLSGITVPASDYKIIKTSKGRLMEVVIEAWKHVWEKWNKDEKYIRAYSTDFEEYGLGAINPENGRARLYISLKS